MTLGIHALLVYKSNPAEITLNQNLITKGLEREELMTVLLDHFMTDEEFRQIKSPLDYLDDDDLWDEDEGEKDPDSPF